MRPTCAPSSVSRAATRPRCANGRDLIPKGYVGDVLSTILIGSGVGSELIHHETDITTGLAQLS